MLFRYNIAYFGAFGYPRMEIPRQMAASPWQRRKILGLGPNLLTCNCEKATIVSVYKGLRRFPATIQHPWLCHPPCLPEDRLRRLSRHLRRLAAGNSEGPLGAPRGGLARPQGESRLAPAEPENAASVPVGTPSGAVSPLYIDTFSISGLMIPVNDDKG